MTRTPKGNQVIDMRLWGRHRKVGKRALWLRYRHPRSVALGRARRDRRDGVPVPGNWRWRRWGGRLAVGTKDYVRRRYTGFMARLARVRRGGWAA